LSPALPHASRRFPVPGSISPKELQAQVQAREGTAFMQP